MAVLQQLLLNPVELPMRNADGRKQGSAILAILADDEIAAAEVFEVVGEGAKSAENRIGIPAGLEFDAFDFNDAGMQQVVDVDGQTADENADLFLRELANKQFCEYFPEMFTT